MKYDFQKIVQDVLDERTNISEIDFGAAELKGVDRFKANSALRVCKFVAKYRQKQISKNDLLVSIRSFLLLTQGNLTLPADLEIDNNPFGLKIDYNGKCYAVADFPEYIDEAIIQQGFLRGYLPENDEKKAFLGVSPNVFRITGFKNYKSLAQKIAVTGALNLSEGYTALVSLPTGGGKSLITQTMSFQEKKGLTIVIVPTVSLAMDQVRVSKENIKIAQDDEIACYYGNMDSAEKSKLYALLNDRKLRLLFISPEALVKNQHFRKVIADAAATEYLRNVIIDEAHIVIEWGTFFRVDYQCLEPWRNSLISSNPKIKTVLLSATFEKDTVKMLKDMFAQGNRWVEIRCDSLRREPRFELIKAKSEADKRRKIIRLLEILPRPMIVYVTAPYQAEEIQKLARDNGFTNVETFTGATKSAERKRVIEQWSNNEFDLIVATSAFGVGVDKPDVRTVLHLYVPENANKYYQELGRGGRDGLPSLSVMCVYPDKDLDSAFYLTTKVLSTEKIVGRWNSMLNSPTSPRYQNSYSLDTSVKPNYSDADYAEDANTADIKWNIYVILLLRRRGLLKITDMTVDPQTQKYMIRVEICDDLILRDSEKMRKLIERIRNEEWKKNESDFQVMSRAVINGNKVCWSEMFYDTYSLVSGYCAGCGKHFNIIDEEPNRFVLVKRVDTPAKAISPDVNKMFSNSMEAVLLTDLSNYDLLTNVIEKGFQTLVFDDKSADIYVDLLLNLHTFSNINFMGMSEYMKLLEERDYYYVSGATMVIYEEGIENIYRKMTKLRRLSFDGGVNLLHVFEKNLYFGESGKDLKSIIDGPVLEQYDIERI